MANTVMTSFKTELLSGDHDIATGGDAYYLALYTSASSINNATTTIYTTANEVPNSGTYVAGGLQLAGQAVSASGTTAIVDFTDRSFTSATITARYALIYKWNASPGSTKAVCVLDFGSDQTSTSGTFTIQFPAAGAGTAIIRVA